jgi:hypothetical protein
MYIKQYRIVVSAADLEKAKDLINAISQQYGKHGIVGHETISNGYGDKSVIVFIEEFPSKANYQTIQEQADREPGNYALWEELTKLVYQKNLFEQEFEFTD